MRLSTCTKEIPHIFTPPYCPIPFFWLTPFFPCTRMTKQEVWRAEDSAVSFYLHSHLSSPTQTCSTYLAGGSTDWLAWTRLCHLIFLLNRRSETPPKSVNRRRFYGFQIWNVSPPGRLRLLATQQASYSCLRIAAQRWVIRIKKMNWDNEKK